MTDQTRMRLFEFLATPAHGWLWLCAKITGLDFEFGPTDEDGNFLDAGKST